MAITIRTIVKTRRGMTVYLITALFVSWMEEHRFLHRGYRPRIVPFPSLPPAIRLYTTTYTNVARFQEASSERKETLFLRYRLIPLSMMIYAIKRQVKRFLYMRAARFKLCDEPRDNDTLESIAV